MKIAIVTETFLPSTDGVVTRMVHAVDYLLEQGHQVLILSPKVKGAISRYKSAKVLNMPALNFSFYKERAWGIPTSKVGKALKGFQPDIVHCVNPISLGYSGVHYAKKYQIPLICSFHTNVPMYLDLYHMGTFKEPLWGHLRKLHNSASLNLVTSKAMAELLASQRIENIRTLPIGVDLSKRHVEYASKRMRRRLTDGQVDKTLLIFVGRLAPEKELHTLRGLMDLRDDIRLAIVGDGPSREELKELFEGTDTVFTGFLKGRALASAYASADAFVFPSVSETLGLVITESMASGTPVIAADSPPTREQIVNGNNGLIYQQDDLDSLMAAIDVLKDRAFYKKIQKEGRHFASQFSWERASREMEKAYEDVLAMAGEG